MREPTEASAGLRGAAAIIETKLTPPDLPAVLVPRPHLGKRLDDATRIVGVIAPAGFGKTVAVREWAETARLPVAWYSLDALDADPACFWGHVVASLDRAVGLGPEPHAVLSEQGADGTTLIHTLVHALLATGPRVVLLLDDLHRLEDRSTLERLALLVDLAGPGFRLVFTARSAPPLPLARWRLTGELTEIGVDDLRFDDQLAGELLGGLARQPMTEAAVSELVSRTEGWVAGLQLAAIATPDDPRRSLADLPGTGSGVADYLVEEVIDRLPPEHRAVASSLSVLEEFDESLAVSLTGRRDAVRTITELASGNVFVSRVGAGSATYRFHQLLRDVLRDRLRSSDPERWAELHRLAARLLAERGNRDAAFDHYVAAGDLDAAIDLVIRPVLDLNDAGWGREFRRWLDRLPGDLELDDPALILDFAFACFTAGRLDEARRWLGRAAEHVHPADPRIALRRLAIDIAAGDLPGIERALEVLLDSVRIDPEAGFEGRTWPTVARALLLLSRVDDADLALDRAEQGEADDYARLVGVPAIRARVRVVQGELDEGARLAGAALDAADRLGAGRNPAVLEALIAGTAAALGRGRVDDAAVLLADLLDVADVVDYPYSRAHAAALLIESSARERGWAATAGKLDILHLQAGCTAGTSFAQVLAPPRARALLAAGRVQEARGEIASLGAGRAAILLEAAALVVERRFPAALDLLGSRAGWTPAEEVEALVLCALADTGTTAEASLRAALELAAPRGLAAPFLDRGDDLDRLLRRMPEALRHRLFPEPQQSAPTVPRARIEPLSPRERELLTLLPTHLSNAAIAERLFLSVNTVKTNLRSLYRKLGTTSRSESVLVGRALGLLPPEDGTE
ncbi:MAG: LuxR C-terminal-related transcriptional regulator [Acidimicrobiales bacterium]|jgi:LuxR family maltose regulon positive regulatory protein|nr:LuxR C-terminal-related transcriptional regulator [Acidimicrobiales bacterium]